MTTCRRCQGEVVQKPMAMLLLVGIALLASVGLAFLWSMLWLPVCLAGLVGVYLILWATLGRGRWCRGCKRFDGV